MGGYIVYWCYLLIVDCLFEGLVLFVGALGLWGGWVCYLCGNVCGSLASGVCYLSLCYTTISHL